MGKAAKNGFNPKVFLAKVGTGKTISKYPRIKPFSSEAMSRILLLHSRSKSSSYLSETRKRSWQFWSPRVKSVHFANLFPVVGTPPDFGRVVQDYVQQGIMDFRVSVVVNEP
jgi:hypothetical protein